MSNKTRTILISFVVVVWAINISAGIVVHDYKPTPELNIGFTMIIGALVPGYRTNGKQGGKE